MREITLTAATRDESFIGSSSSRRLRREGRVPAIVYGLDKESIAITVDSREVYRALAQGANALINLEVADGDGQLTMTREVQRHPIKGDVLHVDFVRIRADQDVQADVPLHLTGEPAGLKEGGVLEHVLFTISVSAKPRDLPESMELDVSELGIGDSKRVEDLEAPAGVEIVTDPEQVVASVVVPRIEEEGPTLSAEEAAELEGLSEEELAELRELAAARAPEEGEEAAEEGAEEAAAKEGPGEDEGE